ncbi:MAG: hypothetical protein NTY08_19235 [Proteobacteria bacterium]|nr:hypothetical protein [Pseudomonadota bacterium]
MTTIDVTAATTVYYTPFNGNRVALYDGTANWNIVAFSEQTLSLGTLTAGANYDVFAYNSAGTVSLVLGAAWTNNTTRSTALALQDGVWVQSGTTTRRYLGTIRTTSTTTTEDSNVKRFVWNANNRVPRTQMQTDTTTNWANAGNGAWSAMNSGNAAWQEQFLIGLAGDPVESGIDMYVSYMGSIGIALDSTSAVNSSNSTVSYTCCTNVAVNSSVHYRGYPAAGYHYMQGLQTTQSSTTVYFYGSTLSSCGGGGAGCLNSGMYTRLLQ